MCKQRCQCENNAANVKTEYHREHGITKRCGVQTTDQSYAMIWQRGVMFEITLKSPLLQISPFIVLA